jgi:phosphoglycerate dehydrogenase-like enzyme
MAKSYTLFSNAQLPYDALARLHEGTRSHRVLLASAPVYNLAAGGADPNMAEADIALGQPDPDQIIASPKLNWVHLTTAGYTRYDRDDLREALKARGGVLTNSSSVYDEPCAQHVLAFMLALSRQLPQCVTVQNSVRDWRYAEHRRNSFLLRGQSVLILGFGAIARRLVEMLAPFQMDIKAIRRTVTGREPVSVHAMDGVDPLLPHADHVINILPASASTEQFMNATRFEAMKPGSIYYNIGRGTTTDQLALLKHLQSGKLAAAYLDVTDPEPLPPDHPLWTAPNCHITPHTAGGHRDEFHRLVQHFLDNLQRYEQGQKLRDRII